MPIFWSLCRRSLLDSHRGNFRILYLWLFHLRKMHMIYILQYVSLMHVFKFCIFLLQSFGMFFSICIEKPQGKKVQFFLLKTFVHNWLLHFFIAFSEVMLGIHLRLFYTQHTYWVSLLGGTNHAFLTQF